MIFNVVKTLIALLSLVGLICWHVRPSVEKSAVKCGILLSDRAAWCWLLWSASCVFTFAQTAVYFIGQVDSTWFTVVAVLFSIAVGIGMLNFAINLSPARPGVFNTLYVLANGRPELLAILTDWASSERRIRLFNVHQFNDASAALRMREEREKKIAARAAERDRLSKRDKTARQALLGGAPEHSNR